MTIADLAAWPKTEEDVTVANIRRSLLVWAKVYECRLVDELDLPTGRVLAAATAASTAAGVLLGDLQERDPDAALKQARLYWCGSDDGEVFADALLDALDEIDPELAEAVVDAYAAEVGKALLTPKFEIYRDAKGGYRWRLKDAAGTVIASCGESYQSVPGAREAIAGVQADAPDAPVDEAPR